ncbi:MAG: metallophosphoesterase family protein [Gammaproteobacteria bacterium]
MKKPFTVVHISDIHSQPSRKRELQIRVRALIHDLKQCSASPNLLIVSGDIAYSGKENEFETAREVLNGLFHQLGISPQQAVFCIGNHDIDRDQIDPMTEIGLKRSLLDTEAAEEIFDHPSYTNAQQQSFLDFLKNLTGKTFSSPSYSQVFELNRLRVGVASFNSAWRCSDDESKEQLFLTLPQVHQLSEQISDCHLTIAVVHHPFNWFHPSEADIVHSDLMRRFDIVLTGHLHHAITTSTQTPGVNSLVYSVPSFFDGAIDGQADGYNIYYIDPTERNVRCQHRKFIRTQERFDRNVEHAVDGESSYNLPHRELAPTLSIHLVQRMTDAATSLEACMRRSLQSAQKLDTPILNDPYNAAIQSSCLVYGPADCGTTVFLQGLCSSINSKNQDRYALYFDHADVESVKRPEQLLRIVRNRAVGELGSLGNVQLTVAVDHVSYTDGEFIRIFLNLAAQEQWHTLTAKESEARAVSPRKRSGRTVFRRASAPEENQVGIRTIASSHLWKLFCYAD